jgi:peptide/nickel transport system permease protein
VSLLLYTLRRVLWTVPTLLGALVVIFVLTRAIPGDAALIRVGKSYTPETLAAVRASMGLDQPLPLQFLTYVRNLSQGNLGHSWKTGNAVALDLKDRLPATLELVLWTLLLSVPVGIGLGLVSAAWPGSPLGRVIGGYTLIGLGMPVFWLSLMAIHVFFFLLGWAPPPTGRLGILDTPPETITGLYLIDALLAGDLEVARKVAAHLVLPVGSLLFIVAAPIARVTAGAMSDELGSDHIRAATAAGIPRREIIGRFALKNIMIPIMTLIGVMTRFLIGGAVLTEIVFSWPGLGRYAIESMLVADLAPLQAVVLIITAATLAINIVIDVSYFWFDPRIKVS